MGEVWDRWRPRRFARRRGQPLASRSTCAAPERVQYKTSDAWAEYIGSPDRHCAVRNYPTALRETSGASVFLTIIFLHYER